MRLTGFPPFEASPTEEAGAKGELFYSALTTAENCCGIILL